VAEHELTVALERGPPVVLGERVDQRGGEREQPLPLLALRLTDAERVLDEADVPSAEPEQLEPPHAGQDQRRNIVRACSSVNAFSTRPTSTGSRIRHRFRGSFGRSAPSTGHLAAAEDARRALLKQQQRNEPPNAVAAQRNVELIPAAQLATWKDNETPRHARIFATLQRAMRLENKIAAEMKWLFKQLRDPAVHPETRFAPTEPHPLGFNTSPDNVRFSVESARRAVALLDTVLSRAVDRPRAEWAGWTAELRPIAETVRAR
jgi:hypothetical protein